LQREYARIRSGCCLLAYKYQEANSAALQLAEFEDRRISNPFQLRSKNEARGGAKSKITLPELASAN